MPGTAVVPGTPQQHVRGISMYEVALTTGTFLGQVLYFELEQRTSACMRHKGSAPRADPLHSRK